MDDRNKKLIVIGGGLAAVAICCVVALLAFIVIDPFGWFGGLLGGRDPIAGVMPADSDLYVGMNMAQLLSGDAEAVVSTIVESIPGTETREIEDMLDEMVEEILYDYGMTFSSDISPWLGQHLGMSMSNLRFDYYGDGSGPDIIIAIEVRNRAAADDFIADFIDAREREEDETYRLNEYRGVDVYELDGRYMSEAICRSGDILIIGSSADAVESVIDAQKGDSLADQADFESMSSRFPNRRFLTFYIGSGFAESYMDLMGALGQGPTMTTGGLQNFAMTMTFTNFGLQLDSFMPIDERAVDQYAIIDSTDLDGDLIAKMPEDTLGFFVGQRLDLIWESIEEAMEVSYGGDFSEAMLFFYDEFGIRPDTDLFPILDGEWAWVLQSGSNSSLGRELGGLSLLMMAESSDEDEIEDVVSDIARGLERSGLSVRELEAPGGIVYVAQEGGDDLFAFGTQDGVLFLGTDSDILIDTMEGNSSIEDDTEFQDVWDEFPRTTIPVLYLNLNSLLETYMDLEDYDWEDLAWEIGLDPRAFTHLAAGSGGYSRGSFQATIMIFIETD
jgi:hypothetical protein